MRQLFTAADIRRVAREQKSDLLVLGHGDLITPEAVDRAKELGVRLVREPPPEHPLRPNRAQRCCPRSKSCAARVC